MSDELRTNPCASGHETCSGVEELQKSFELKLISVLEFWQGLDELASSRKISSAAQREIFWDSLSPPTRQEILQWSAYFDPSNPIWKGGSHASIRAEQVLEHVMEFSALYGASFTMTYRKCGCLFFLFLLVLLWIIDILPDFWDGRKYCPRFRALFYIFWQTLMVIFIRILIDASSAYKTVRARMQRMYECTVVGRPIQYELPEMSNYQPMTVRPPVTYDFNDWALFYRDALSYHSATRPDDHLVSDRIETFRKFMSNRVTEHLRGFVRPHPRYETTYGWTEWVLSVQCALEDQVEVQLRAVEIDEYDLWQRLEAAVRDGHISSMTQRQKFWETLSWEAQMSYLQRSPYFDPHNEIWNDSPATKAEQELSQIMELSMVADRQKKNARAVAKMKFFAKLLPLSFVALVLTERGFAAFGKDIHFAALSGQFFIASVSSLMALFYTAFNLLGAICSYRW